MNTKYVRTDFKGCVRLQRKQGERILRDEQNINFLECICEMFGGGGAFL